MSRGFTLIEVMIAVMILGLVVTAVYTTFTMILKSSERMKVENTFFLHDRLLVNLLNKDFQGLFVITPPRYKKPEDRQEEDYFYVEGQDDYLEGESMSNLRFVSDGAVNPDSTGKTALVQIYYYVSQDEDGILFLKRASSLELDANLTESTDHPVLVRNIKKFSIRYYDSKGDEFESWNSEADTNNYETPAAITVKLLSEIDDVPHAFEKTFRIINSRVMGE